MPRLSTYDPIAYRVFVAPASQADAQTVDWPLDSTLADFGSPQTPNFGVDGLRSGIVSGADALALATALSDATTGTLIVSGGAEYEAWIRPLLPPEIV